MSRQLIFLLKKFSYLTLRNKVLILTLLFVSSCFLAYFGTKVKIATTEIYLLPQHHIATQQHKKFVEIFGEDGSQIIIAINTKNFSERQFELWNQLLKKIDTVHHGVIGTLGTHNLKTISRDSLNQLDLTSLNFSSFSDFKNKLDRLPFYDNLIYNNKTDLLIGIIFFDPKVLNTPQRSDFIENYLEPIIANFEQKGLNLHISGMPYIRTKNTDFLANEMGWLVGGALFLTSFVFYLFFRSIFSTLIALLIIGITTIWVYGYIGLLGYEITIFTALIPPIIIVIGIPNCIFLINHYLDGIKAHGNKNLSLTSVITKMGSITLLTNLTTASSFIAFLFTDSQSLQRFGLLSSISILSMFLLSIILVPIFYSFGKKPSNRYLIRKNKKWLSNFITWKLYTSLYKKKEIFTIASIICIISIFGITQIKTTGSYLEELPKEESFYKDILFLEENSNGLLTYQIVIDTKRREGIYNASTLRKVDKLQKFLENIPEISLPLSIVNVIKFTKQGYYNGNPEYYDLPSNLEKNFILSSLRSKSISGNGFLSSFTDKEERYLKITLFSKEISDTRFNEIESSVLSECSKLFPKENYEVFLSGKALLFQKGTQYLVKNLFTSLILSFLFIFILMCLLFKSLKLSLISLIPNILPLLTTSGLMGYLDIPLKPSTVLVFGVALGVAVDDTIHFMARFRQTLPLVNMNIKIATISALKHTASSMLYSSAVLFFGFLFFTLSGFGGTAALGSLVAITLLFAVFTDLILLPALLLFWRNSL